MLVFVCKVFFPFAYDLCQYFVQAGHQTYGPIISDIALITFLYRRIILNWVYCCKIVSVLMMLLKISLRIGVIESFVWFVNSLYAFFMPLDCKLCLSIVSILLWILSFLKLVFMSLLNFAICFRLSLVFFPLIKSALWWRIKVHGICSHPLVFRSLLQVPCWIDVLIVLSNQLYFSCNFIFVVCCWYLLGLYYLCVYYFSFWRD